ncbi:DnaB-like helicase C-terminal domain-containing protein [Cupriavidus metallidurans]|uniref:DnaB-like helicase C-terminal domain-containing protein n=1 Tax=Cupriavidus metallidurans TaxID=119219 RepID=UPI001CCD971B|nr:DnaB-like helicase C-terminal domain-containing protein [Cupriavidus metallidurans]UBM12738.1 AAA family ATPase [Cupriavidus metallidurans]
MHAAATGSLPAAVAGAPLTIAHIPGATALFETTETYSKALFGDDFQNRVAALACRDMKFMQATEGLIQPKFFDNGLNGHVVRIASDFYKKYRRLPNDGSIWTRVLTDEMVAKRLSKDDARLVAAKLHELFGVDISDRDYVVDRTVEFAKHQAVQSAILNSVNLLERREFDRVNKMITDAVNIGKHEEGGAYDMREQLMARTADRIDRLMGKKLPQGITTGVPKLDARLYHQGWGRKELSVLLGGAKTGKTTALLNFAINATAAGFNVLYLTLEVSAAIIADRMDSNISEIKAMELFQHHDTVRQKVTEFFDRTRANLKVHEFPTGTLSVSDLRRIIERYKGQGVLFDMVVVDYADLMRPDRHSDQAIENSKSIYIGLRGLAMEENIALLTATQANREGYKSAVVKAEHVAEDFNKVRIADILISISLTDEERANGYARLFFAAARNSASGFSLTIMQDIERMKFIKDIVEEGAGAPLMPVV